MSSGFDGTRGAAAEEIETLRASLGKNVRVQPHPYVVVGQRVSLRSGPLAGADWNSTAAKEGSEVCGFCTLDSEVGGSGVDEADLVRCWA